jgi:hypothetical protein
MIYSRVLIIAAEVGVETKIKKGSGFCFTPEAFLPFPFDLGKKQKKNKTS